MDPKARMPDIKSEVNKVDDGDKKKTAGVLGSLFGGGSGGAAGLGGLGGGAAAAGGGGLLATKAGLIALVVMGSAVAGGLGLAGYKMFGPGESDRVGGNLSLFAPKPQEQAADPNAVAPVNKDGSSASLDYMAQAAAKERGADGSALSDQTAGDAAKDAAGKDGAADGSASAGANAGAGGAINGDSGAAGAIGSMGKTLAGTKKLGELSKGVSGGGSSSASASAGKLGEGLAAAGRGGTSSSFSGAGPGARASASSGRGVASRRASSARNQLGNVMRDQRGAQSSIAAGPTYDGSSKSAGNPIGSDGSPIGMDGNGTGTDAQPKALQKNSAGTTREQDVPIPKTKEVITPWVKATQRAMMLTLLAAGLAFMAGKIPPSPHLKPILYAIGAIISAIGVYIGVLAGQVMSGPHGQMMQGMVVAAASVGVIATGIGVMMGANKSTNSKPEVVDPSGGSGAGAPPAEPAVAGNNALGGGMKGIMANPMVMLGGGLAVVAGIGLMFMPKPKAIELKDGESKPDVRYEARPNPARYAV